MTAYTNQLRGLLSDPNAFQETPGYRFIRDQALEATQRQNASQRGSANALIALMDRGAGLAATEYGSTVDRLGRLEGQEQQFELGSEANRLTGARDANAYSLGHERNVNDFSLGNEQNAIARLRAGNDFTLGEGTLNNARRSADQTFGATMYRAGNDYDLGVRNADNTQRGQWYDYTLGKERNALTGAEQENRYNLDSQRIPLDWYRARTERGSARSTDWLRGDESSREWRKLNPPRMMF